MQRRVFFTAFDNVIKMEETLWWIVFRIMEAVQITCNSDNLDNVFKKIFFSMDWNFEPTTSWLYGFSIA